MPLSSIDAVLVLLYGQTLPHFWEGITAPLQGSDPEKKCKGQRWKAIHSLCSSRDEHGPRSKVSTSLHSKAHYPTGQHTLSSSLLSSYAWQYCLLPLTPCDSHSCRQKQEWEQRLISHILPQSPLLMKLGVWYRAITNQWFFITFQEKWGDSNWIWSYWILIPHLLFPECV